VPRTCASGRVPKQNQESAMEYNEVRTTFIECPDLAGVDEESKAFLLLRGQEMVFPENEVIYAEGTKLDDTFCLLLNGYLKIEKGGALVGEITEPHIFGEMAYFSPLHLRSAAVRVGSPNTSVLKIQLTLEELDSARFVVLKNYLGLKAWDRFVSNQSVTPEEGIATQDA
jgi:hypothetical protein